MKIKEMPVYARIYFLKNVFYVIDSPPYPDHKGVLHCRCVYATKDIVDNELVYTQPRKIIFSGTYALEYLDGEKTVQVEYYG